jgi:hypothetical protein
VLLGGDGLAVDLSTSVSDFFFSLLSMFASVKFSSPHRPVSVKLWTARVIEMVRRVNIIDGIRKMNSCRLFNLLNAEVLLSGQSAIINFSSLAMQKAWMCFFQPTPSILLVSS